MNPFRKIKEPRVLLPLIMLIAAAGFCGFAILSRISANPAFCVSCHNMQPEYDSYVQGDLLARKHADAGVTCHDCHEPTMLQQMNEGWLFVTGNYENPMPQYGYTNAQCLSCHPIGEIKAATAHYGKENPHDPVHLAGNENPQNCMDCHSMHHSQSAKKCTKCHDVSWQLDASWEK